MHTLLAGKTLHSSLVLPTRLLTDVHVHAVTSSAAAQKQNKNDHPFCPHTSIFPPWSGSVKGLLVCFQWLFGDNEVLQNRETRYRAFVIQKILSSVINVILFLPFHGICGHKESMYFISWIIR